MKKIRILCVLLVVVMLSGCVRLEFLPELPSTSQAPEVEPTPGDEPTPEPTLNPDMTSNEYFDYIVPDSVDFSSLTYESADLEALRAKLDELAELGDTATDFSQIEELYIDINDDFVELATMSSLAYVQYSMDVNNEELQANDLEASKNGIDASDAFEHAALAVLQGDYHDEFAELIDEEYAEELLEKGTKSEEQLELEYLEEELVQEYIELSAQETSVQYGGRTWTMDDLENAYDISYNDFFEIYDLLNAERKNSLLGNFAELVEVRKEIATLEGYETYTDYAYEEVFERDFSPEDSRKLYEDVKEEIVPLYNDMSVYASYSFDFSMDTDEMLPLIEEHLARLSPLFQEPLDYMRDNGLYAITDDPSVSKEGAYVTEFNDYDAPFIYAHTRGTYNDVSTFVHELGHYTEAYYNTYDRLNEPYTTLDVAEVHSTALELLFYDSFEEIYDDSAIMYTFLAGTLSLIADASLFDEFLQRVYATDEELSGEEIDELFYELSSEMNYTAWDGYWTEVGHHFEVPFYYISYGASTLVSLDMFRVKLEQGQDVAVDLYFEYMANSMLEDVGYFELLDLADLESFLDDGYVQRIANLVETELYSILGYENSYDMSSSSSLLDDLNELFEGFSE